MILDWLPLILTDLWAVLKGIQIYPGVSLFHFMVSAALLFVATRAIIVKR